MANVIKKLIIYQVLTLVLYGCASVTSSNPQQRSLPEWAKKPPLDTNGYWYGIGSGYNRDLATKSALSEIASRLKVAVQSTVETYGRKTTGNGQVTASEHISIVEKLSTGEVSFPGYDIQRAEESDGQIYALVAVDRGRFVRQYRSDIDAADRRVRESLARLRNKQPIEQYLGKSELQEDAYQLLDFTDLLATADQSFAGAAQGYRQRVDDALSAVADVKSRLRFHIVADDQSRYLDGAVREMIAEEDFPVTERQGRDDTLIKVSSALLHQGRDAIGGYEISIKTQIILQTAQGHIVGNRRLTLYGASTMNYDYALQALADDFKRKVDNAEGIFAFLGAFDAGEI